MFVQNEMYEVVMVFFRNDLSPVNMHFQKCLCDWITCACVCTAASLCFAERTLQQILQVCLPRLRFCWCWHVWDSSGSVTGEASAWPYCVHLLHHWQVTRRGPTVAIGNGRKSKRVSFRGNLEDHGWALSSSELLASVSARRLARKGNT